MQGSCWAVVDNRTAVACIIGYLWSDDYSLKCKALADSSYYAGYIGCGSICNGDCGGD
jgi:hypothetical protein